MTKESQALTEIGAVVCADQIELDHWQHRVDELQVQMIAQRKSSLAVRNPNRKWELVSAYQKSVRRGHSELAQHLVCGMVSLQDERQYMWKRICTTACEDIGAGDPQLMKFVLAVSSVYTPSKMTGQQALDIWCWLTQLMCEAQKSRLYCQWSIMEGCIRSGQIQRFQESALGMHVHSVLSTKVEFSIKSPGDAWLCKADWRGEGMASGPIRNRDIQTQLVANDWKPPQHRTIAGLPAYAYDMHTSVGKRVCVRLCGNQQVKQLLDADTPENRATAIGWALFFEEGGKIQNELVDSQQAELEQRVVAYKMCMTTAGWTELRQVVRWLLEHNQVDALRERVVSTQGYAVKHPE